MNELSKKFDARGLSVIGVTGEPEAPTVEWVAKHEARYAYGYSADFIRKMEITSYPTAILVSPAGEVLYRGSPSGVNDALIEKHLDDALKVPAWEWPKEADATKKALQKDDLGKAVEQAESLSQEGVEHGAEILAAVKSLAAGRAKSIAAAAERGDFLTVAELGKVLKKSLKGLPEMEQVDAAIAASKTGDAKKVMKLQKKVRDIVQDVSGTASRKKVEEAVAELAKIAEKNDDNYAGTEAKKNIEKLEATLQRMR